MSESSTPSPRQPGRPAAPVVVAVAPAKARVTPVRLYAELYQIAGGSPGKGAATLYRVRAICQQLYENHPDLDLLEQLRRLQELMVDWTSESGWKRHGNGSGPATLRERLMDCIDEISGLAEPSAAIPAPVARMAKPAVARATLGAGGI